MICLHALWFVSCVVASLGGIKLYISYQKTREENLGYFYKIFIFVGLFFLFTSLPGILKNPSLVQMSYMLSWASIFPASFLGVKILSTIWDLPKIKEITMPAALVSVIFVSVLNVLHFKPSGIVSFGNYWYWTEGTPLWLQAFAGGIVGIFTFLTGLLFIIGGIKSKDKAILNRSFLIGGGFIILALQAISAYVFFTLSSTFVLFAAFYPVVGILMVYFGIRYRMKR